MLSYRHSFHAGNHADVLKHIVQSLIIESLKEKETPFLYLDTHAGAGRYQLSGKHVDKTEEYFAGIARLWKRDDLPAELAAYLAVLTKLNAKGDLHYYPGSPLLAKFLLREQDKLILSELHPSDYPILRAEFVKDRRAQVLRQDGFQQLKSKLPPLSRRGIILIDPSYELKSDYQSVVKGILAGYKRFANGIYAIWYPVVLRQQVKRMIHGLQNSGIRKILKIELAVCPDSDQRGITASGIIVINPPWKLEQQMRVILPWLHKVLVPEGIGHTCVEWIVSE